MLLLLFILNKINHSIIVIKKHTYDTVLHFSYSRVPENSWHLSGYKYIYIFFFKAQYNFE